MATRQRGRVKWFSARNGYGFVIPNTQPDLEAIVHFTQIIGQEGFRTLDDGAEVEFELRQGERGWMAIQVEQIGLERRRADSVPPPMRARPNTELQHGLNFLLNGHKAPARRPEAPR